MRSGLILVLRTLAAASVACLGIIEVNAQQSKIDVKGFKRTPIAEQVIDGPLAELNGKYKMTAFTFDPGDYVGPHLHAGPGWRCVTSGEVTNIEADGKSTVYGAGQCYWESGLKSHTPRNNGDKPATGIVIELLPSSLAGSSLMPVPPDDPMAKMKME